MFDELGSETAETLSDLAQAAPGSSVYVGRIVRCKRSGRVLVEFDDGEQKEARLVAGLKREQLVRAADKRSEVLTVFERGDTNRPIIVALMENAEETPLTIKLDEKHEQQPMQAVVDDETIKIEAKKQIILKCGKGSITIGKDGRIVIRGTRLLSRSSGPNRIKGGHVDIN